MQSFSPRSASSCTTKDVLEQFLSGHLPGEVSERLAEHLEQCAACSETLQEVSLTTEFSALRLPSAGKFPVQEMPAGLRADLYGLAEEPAASQPLATSSLEPSGNRQFLGRFELRECLGRGAHGTVYLAWDPSLQREVALKIPRYALLDQAMREHFLREGRTTGRLQHPNIVLIHEVGEVDGTCYLALAYCPGPTLATWMSQQATEIEPRVATDLVRKLADAVAYAHSEGVLHRDLKPENVILEPASRQAPAAFEPKLTDFGVAKLLDRGTSDTRTGVVIGTLLYMAPEQASGQREAIGPTADIYSLGAILYEMLTGRLPHRGATQAETLRRILFEEPVAPRKLRPEVPRDLEAICLKCLEKHPERRYQQAAELGEDLRRFLAGEPTRARPMGWPERARRWSQRNPSWALLGILLLVSLASGVGGLLLHLQMLSGANQSLQTALGQARDDRQRAIDSQRHTRHALYCSDLQLAAQAFEAGDARHAAMLLARHVPGPGEEDARCLGWHWLHRLVTAEREPIPGHRDDVYFVRFSPDRKQFATAGAEGIVRLFDAHTKRLIREIATQQGEVNSIAFHPTRPEIASAGDDGSIAAWNLQDGAARLRIAAHQVIAYGVCYTPDGQHVISCANEPVIKVWDATTGRLSRELTEHTKAVEAMAVSPDGQWLATASSDCTARLWSLPDLAVRHVLVGPEKPLHCVGFSPDSTQLAAGGADDLLRVFSVASGEEIFAGRHVETVQAVAFSRDPPGIVSTDRSGAVHWWPRDEAGHWPAAPRSWTSDADRIWALADAGAAGFIAAGRAGQVELWSWPAEAPVRRVQFSEKHDNVAFHPDGRRLWCAAGTAGLVEFDLQSNPADPKIKSLLTDVDCVGMGLHPSGKLLVADRSGWMRVHDAQTLAVLHTFDLPGDKNMAREFHATREPAETLVEMHTENDGLYAYNLQHGLLVKRSFPKHTHTAAVAPNGNLLATSFRPGNQIQLLDLAGHRELATLPGHASTVDALRFSPDGRWLVSGGSDRLVKIWDVAGRSLVMTLIGHRAKVNGVDFSPQGDQFVTASADGTIRLWDTTSGRMLMVLYRDTAGFEQVDWSPDGRYIVANVAKGQGLVLLEAEVPAATLPRQEQTSP
ncbi:MAG: serine/threonine protein kinase [Pirellulaceae bacterium]|nr:serine/threonine protein kinase [Pirellulaceae bacterium]